MLTIWLTSTRFKILWTWKRSRKSWHDFILEMYPRKSLPCIILLMYVNMTQNGQILKSWLDDNYFALSFYRLSRTDSFLVEFINRSKLMYKLLRLIRTFLMWMGSTILLKILDIREMNGVWTLFINCDTWFWNFLLLRNVLNIFQVWATLRCSIERTILYLFRTKIQITYINFIFRICSTCLIARWHITDLIERVILFYICTKICNFDTYS